VAELVRAHDLGADPRTVPLREGVVDAAATTARLPALAPPLGHEHPFVQPLPGVTEMQFGALTLSGAEAVERDGEVVDADK
jgi:hypothetical protein